MSSTLLKGPEDHGAREAGRTRRGSIADRAGAAEAGERDASTSSPVEEDTTGEFRDGAEAATPTSPVPASGHALATTQSKDLTTFKASPEFWARKLPHRSCAECEQANARSEQANARSEQANSRKRETEEWAAAELAVAWEKAQSMDKKAGPLEAGQGSEREHEKVVDLSQKAIFLMDAYEVQAAEIEEG